MTDRVEDSVPRQWHNGKIIHLLFQIVPHQIYRCPVYEDIMLPMQSVCVMQNRQQQGSCLRYSLWPIHRGFQGVFLIQ